MLDGDWTEVLAGDGDPEDLLSVQAHGSPVMQDTVSVSSSSSSWNKDRGNELTRHSTSCRLLVFQIGSVLRFAKGLTRHKEFQTRAGTMLSIFSSS